MAVKLKCPYCGKCIGETIEIDEDADVTTQTKRPTKTKKQKVVIEKSCQHCKDHYYLIVNEQVV